MTKKRVFVAGATGYLGGYLVRELHAEGYEVRALIRAEHQRAELEPFAHVVLGQATDPETLAGLMDGCDAVFSSLGITRQRDGMTYEDVDYQANVNLLREAERAGVESFLYVSVLRGDEMRDVSLIAAKERFVDALEASGVRACVIRPSGFFSDMRDFLEMARGGRAYLLGDGQSKLNPIHGKDLATACIRSWRAHIPVTNVGGPNTYTHDELAEAAFNALNKKPKIWHLPTWIVPITLFFLRWFAPSATYGPAEFFLSAMTRGDMVGDACGTHTLEDFFTQSVEQST